MPDNHQAQSRNARPLIVLLLAVLVFQGCNALNPLCGSARPMPIIGSLSVTIITFAEVQQGFLLTVNGSQFVSSSVVAINGTTLSTIATSSQQDARTRGLRCHWLPNEIHVAVHRLCQLRIHLIRDSHDIGQQQTEIQCAQIVLQHIEQGHLQYS